MKQMDSFLHFSAFFYIYFVLYFTYFLYKNPSNRIKNLENTIIITVYYFFSLCTKTETCLFLSSISLLLQKDIIMVSVEPSNNWIRHYVLAIYGIWNGTRLISQIKNHNIVPTNRWLLLISSIVEYWISPVG